MKPQVIGDYEIGYECIRLVLRDGDGAEFDLLPKNLSIPIMSVGADNADWKQVVARVIHEAFELVSLRLGCRFYPCGDIASNSAAYVFMLDHQRFADCCAKVADFLVVALPDLATAWKQRIKQRG